MDNDISETDIDTVLKYSFPTCNLLKYSRMLTPDEKHNILTSEFLQLSSKINKKLVQVTNTVYDLFVLLDYFQNYPTLNHIVFDPPICKTYNAYCTNVQSNMIKIDIYNFIMRINKQIYMFLQTNSLDSAIDILVTQIYAYIDKHAKSRLSILMEEINSLVNYVPDNYYEKLVIPRKGILRKIISEHGFDIKMVGLFDNILMNKKSNDLEYILTQIKYILFRNFFDNNEESLVTHKALLRKVEILENAILLKSDTYLLYRGSTLSTETPINLVDDSQGYSLSYNLSLLNGIIHDDTACTFLYMLPEETKRIYVEVPKYITHQKSEYEELLFIPPIHRIQQIYGKGEFFHARTKVFKGSKIVNVNQFAGTFKDTYEVCENDDICVINPECFPNFLVSSLEKDNYMRLFASLLPYKFITGGGVTSKRRSNTKKITFIKHGKRYTRMVYVNSRGTEYIKFEKNIVKLKTLQIV